jgi:ketosteroid isomerase-like protein
MSAPGDKAAVEAVIDALNEQDFDRFKALVSEDLTWTQQSIALPGAGVPMDVETVLKTVPKAMTLWSDGPRIRITQMIAEDGWVAMEGRGEGTFIDGEPYENRYAFVFEVVNGKVKTMREYADTLYVGNAIARITSAQG